MLTAFLAGLRFHSDGAGLQGFAKWKEDVAAIAPHPNIYAKLGGHGMPAFGFGWADQPRPPSSEEVAEATLPFYGHLLDALPASRCMFEVRHGRLREAFVAPVDPWLAPFLHTS